MNILVVEPSRRVREFFQSGLQQATVHTVANGHQAIEVLDTQLIDLCFINPQLPINSGIELLYEKASYQDLRSIPVIILADDIQMYRQHEEILDSLGVVGYVKRTDISRAVLEKSLAKVRELFNAANS